MLATTAELLESYRLRYEVYGALGYLKHANDCRLDIDEYDASAIPFGAFDAETGAMIGTLRLITGEPQSDYDYMLRYIVASTGDRLLARRAWGPYPHPLPSIVSRDIDRELDAYNTARYPVYELSRCIVHPERRGAGVSRGLMELGLAHAAQPGPCVLIGSCLPEHVAMYRRYGYRALTEDKLELFDSVGQVASAVVCRSDRLPEPTGSHIAALLASIAARSEAHVRELGRGELVYRLSPPRRARRRTMEW